MSFTWTDELRAELLACTTDAEMEEAFPDHKLENLQRRYREFGGKRRPTSGGADNLSKFVSLLEASGIPIDEISKIDRLTVKQWQAMHKDDAGNAIITDLEGAGIVLTPAWAEGPKWVTVQQAPAAIIQPPTVKYVKSKTKTGIIMPDMQVGYGLDRQNNKTFEFHDERAIDVMFQIMQDFPQIDGLWDVGDGLDNAEFGRFILLPTFAELTNRSTKRLHDILATASAIAPHAKKRFLEGNHDRRIENYILKNAIKAYGLVQANGAPEQWPVLSVPFLCNFDSIGWEYVGGYPANIDWVNENLAVVHGDRVRSGGSTAAQVVDDERVSTIFGHIHRRERTDKTRRTYEGYKTNFGASPGCLCHIDGRVPSTKGSNDLYGRPIARAENWQQGFAVVTYEEGNGTFDYEQVSIHEGTAYFRGNRYKSSV